MDKHSVFRVLIALVVGIVVGCFINLGIVNVGSILIRPPDGVPETMEEVRKNLPDYRPVDFAVPLLAHGLGTLSGAFVAARMARRWSLGLGLAVGSFFLTGGLTMVIMVGGPLWFIVADLLLAYLPMGWLGACWAVRGKPSAQS